MSNEKSKPAAQPAPSEPMQPSSKNETGDKSTGRVKFDERGNAVWEWQVTTGAFGVEVSTQRLQKLEHPALSIADDAPTPFETVRVQPAGHKKGLRSLRQRQTGQEAAAGEEGSAQLERMVEIEKAG